MAQGRNIFSSFEGVRHLLIDLFVFILLKSKCSVNVITFVFFKINNKPALLVACASAYLQAPRDQLQQQEISASSCQKEHPRLTGGSKSYMEQRLNGRLHCPQVDVAITVERHYNNEQEDR